MAETNPEYTTIDEYIALFPPDVAERMKDMRAAIHAAAPGASEKISWRMPTFVFTNGQLFHFAAFKKHIGIYPGPEAIEVFGGRLKGYKTSKGTIQLPLSEPLPLDLVRDIAKYKQEL